MIPQEFRLDGKVAIVTGAGRGIGKAVALAMAEAGADVVAAARTAEEIGQTAVEVGQMGRSCLAIPTDVAKSDQVEAMVAKTVLEFGRIDILVNNAGISRRKPIASMSPDERPMSEEEWGRVLNTNLTSVFLCCRAVAPHMMQQGRGTIINISSNLAVKPEANYACYCASKAAVDVFSKATAFEWAKYNIRVNSIQPGLIRTTMSDGLPSAGLKHFLDRICFGRQGEPREVALLAVFLASDASSYITAQNINISGGYK